MKSSEILRKAQEELKRRGWYQGAFAPCGRIDEPDVDPETLPCCAWGALNAAACGDPRKWEFLEASGPNFPLFYLEQAVGRAADALDGTRSVVFWNDEVVQSVDEVLAGLEKAALLAEKEGD